MKKIMIALALLVICGASDASACSWFEQCPAPVVHKTKKAKPNPDLDARVDALTIVITKLNARVAKLEKAR